MNAREIQMYRRRIDRFRQRLEQFFFPRTQKLKARFARFTDEVPFSQRKSLDFKEIAEGQQWGEAWDYAYFYLQGKVPEDWAGEEVVARLNFDGEALVFSRDGKPLQGLSNQSVFDPSAVRDVLPLFSKAKGGEEVELWIEAVGSTLFGIHQPQDPANGAVNRYGHYQATVREMRLCTFDRTVWALALDIDVLNGLLQHLPENSVRFVRVLRALNMAINVFADDPQNALQARQVLQEPLQKRANASELTVYAVGHAHIDTAWLWPVSETIKKCARTFATQVQLIKDYPEYIFGASQQQHYWFIKKHYPQLYAEIKRLVKAGRWELQGGMWVEADCNLISGESMVRQLLHGKNFFKDEFGIDVTNLWLPDVFGYSAALPQILRKSGIKYFLTQKLSWNQVNDFPYTTFLWRGIDGSEVLTHFPPENTYTSRLNTDTLLPGRENFREKEFMDEFLSLFGIGDGGGGPKAEFIEYGRRLADLEGAPKVRFASANEFFNRLEKYRNELPVWIGELYLEMHQGTLTSQARVKKDNRRLEFRLRALEMLLTCLPLKAYPQKELDRLWKKVLINQFHDIIPGSSITKTYHQTHQEYQEVFAACKELEHKAAQSLFTSDKDALVVFNRLPFEYTTVIELPANWNAATTVDGKTLARQKSHEGRVLTQVTLPAMGFLTLKRTEPADREEDSLNQPPPELVLENSRIRYEFDSSGQLIKAFDKEAMRLILKPGIPGNLLQLFEDRPNAWDAWDIDVFYQDQLLEQGVACEAKWLEFGPLQKSLFFCFKMGNSLIEQQVVLQSHSKRLDFRTRVMWREKHRMLRVSFHVDVVTEMAGFDIQFGHIYRPTHRNTSWEKARFEVVGHKYADLSQPDYGVALLNDSKYGYKVEDGELNLNLLRAPTYPDPDCDQGEHTFVYSLLPHVGNLVNSDVMDEALALNVQPLIFEEMSDNKARLPFRVEGQKVNVEAVKRAEKEEALVVRLVESHGKETQVYLEFDRLPRKIVETDLLEWHTLNRLNPMRMLPLQFRPFEIKTLKIHF